MTKKCQLLSTHSGMLLIFQILQFMGSYRPRLAVHFLAVSILLCVFFGCDNIPRVRLIKDGDATFHFQWVEPLKEERIILIRCKGVLFDYDAQIPWEREMLVFFSPGTVVSYAIDRQRAMKYAATIYRSSMPFRWRIDSVEILPAQLRETVLPADVWGIGKDGRFRWSYEHGRILREHPHFLAYSVDKPSCLTFIRK